MPQQNQVSATNRLVPQKLRLVTLILVATTLPLAPRTSQATDCNAYDTGSALMFDSYVAGLTTDSERVCALTAQGALVVCLLDGGTLERSGSVSLPFAGGNRPSLTLDGDVCWVSFDRHLMAVDIQDPANPLVLSDLELPSASTAMTQLGDVLWLGGPDLLGVSANNPTAPALISRAPISTVDLDTDGRYLYAATSAWETGAWLQVIDVSRPSLPLIAWEEPHRTACSTAVAVRDNLLLATYSYTDGHDDDLFLTSYDVAHPESPRRIDDAEVWGREIAWAGSAVVLSRSPRVTEVSDEGTLGILSTEGAIHERVAAAGSILVTSSGPRLYVQDVSAIQQSTAGALRPTLPIRTPLTDLEGTGTRLALAINPEHLSASAVEPPAMGRGSYRFLEVAGIRDIAHYPLGDQAVIVFAATAQGVTTCSFDVDLNWGTINLVTETRAPVQKLTYLDDHLYAISDDLALDTYSINAVTLPVWEASHALADTAIDVVAGLSRLVVTYGDHLEVFTVDDGTLQEASSIAYGAGDRPIVAPQTCPAATPSIAVAYGRGGVGDPAWVELIDLSDPHNPERVHTLPFGTDSREYRNWRPTELAWHGDTVYVLTPEGVAVVDAEDWTAPIVRASLGLDAWMKSDLEQLAIAHGQVVAVFKRSGQMVAHPLRCDARAGCHALSVDASATVPAIVVALVSAMPHRAGSALRFEVTAARPAAATIGVYDVQGRLIERIGGVSQLSAIPTAFEWTGTARRRSGVYWLKAQASAGAAARKVVLIR